MTVPNTTRTAYHGGDGADTSFPYSFRILDETHLQVVITDALGVDTVQVLNTDYTVTGVKESSGTVEMTLAPANGETLKIERIMPLTQLTDFRNQNTIADIPPETLEDAIDYQMMLMQQVNATVGQPDVYTLADRPVASAVYAGTTIRIVDAGSPGERQVCELSADGTTYTWVTTATGGL